MNNSPLISIVVATFNAAPTLERCLESIFSQSYENYQVILIDGGSNDGTFAVIKRFIEKIAYWESQPDRGICHAWNKALQHVTGEWIYFLGADDYFWSSTVLERTCQKLVEAFPQYRIVYGQVALVNRRGEKLETVGNSWDMARKAFGQSLSIPHQGIFHHRSLFDEYGGFDESFHLVGDYDFLTQELLSRNAIYVEGIVAAMQFGGMSTDPKYSLVFLREIRRVQKERGIKYSSSLWWCVTGKLYLRYILWNILGPKKNSIFLDWLRSIRGKPPLWK